MGSTVDQWIPSQRASNVENLLCHDIFMIMQAGTIWLFLLVFRLLFPAPLVFLWLLFWNWLKIHVTWGEWKITQIAKFMGPTWGPSGSWWPQEPCYQGSVRSSISTWLIFYLHCILFHNKRSLLCVIIHACMLGNWVHQQWWAYYISIYGSAYNPQTLICWMVLKNHKYKIML